MSIHRHSVFDAVLSPLFRITHAVLNRGKAIIALLFLCLSIGMESIEAHDIQRHDFQIVTADDSDATKNIVADLLKRFPTAQVVSDSSKRRLKTKNTIYITIGPSALRSILMQGLDGAIVSAFTSSQAYKSILDSKPELHSSSLITGVFAEPSPAVQFRLIAMLYKRPVKVAAILSDKTTYLEPILQRAAKQTGTDLTLENYSKDGNLNRILNRIADASVLLAAPDNTIFNSENIRNILITTYRRNQSVIGFSSSLVKAGTLASTYSDIEDINAQIDEVISDFEVSGKLPEPQFPKYFNVVVNEDVARSLNIIIDEQVKKFSHKPVVRQQ